MNDTEWIVSALFVLAMIVIGAGVLMGALTAVWRRQEERDGKR